MRKRIITLAVASMLTFGVPAASATLVEKVTNTVESAAKSVNVPVNASPSIPTAAPPTKLPVPASPQAPARVPTEAVPPRSPAPTGSSADLPSARGQARSASDSAGSAPRGSGESTKPEAVSAGSDETRPSPSSPGGSAGKARRGAGGAASSPPLSVAPVEEAALRRWLARVWPAVALGDDGAGGGLVAWVGGDDLFRRAVAVIAPLVSLVSSIARQCGASASRPVRSARAHSPHADLASPALPTGEKKVVYFLALAGLLAFLAFTIWKEFRSVLRTRLR